jgi:hypothetical protein
MPNLTPVTTLIAEIGILIAALTPCVVLIVCLVNGMRCLLRQAMLNTYYHHKETEKIRQYEKENFVHLYKAYKALKGNSFIDDIYKEVRTWEVIS